MKNQMKVRIVELLRSNGPFPKLKYEYTTDQHYHLRISHSKKSWTVKLVLKPYSQPLKKHFEGELFADFVEEPRAFAALLNRKQVGWIETGYHKWNNRVRIWQFLVEEKYRRRGIGSQLMQRAITLAREKDARMIILETQGCNVKAIQFYLTLGFRLIGFDTAAYSNKDMEKGEVRLELGLRL